MASMREIKRRKGSIQSTRQITRAMKLVSTVKLQRAREKAESARAYVDCMYQTMSSLLSRAGENSHPYLRPNGSDKMAVVAVTSNRGLAGSYNSAIVKLIEDSGLERENVRIYAVGTRGMELLRYKGYEIAGDFSEMTEEPSYGQARNLAAQLLRDFEEGKIGGICLAYTFFRNTVYHEPRFLRLLPAQKPEDGTGEPSVAREESTGTDPLDALTPMNFEGGEETVIGLLMPKYISSMLYGALTESAASENGARMQAMDSATSNADEMIEELELLYNQARQGEITQELTEIIAGAEALG